MIWPPQTLVIHQVERLENSCSLKFQSKPANKRDEDSPVDRFVEWGIHADSSWLFLVVRGIPLFFPKTLAGKRPYITRHPTGPDVLRFEEEMKSVALTSVSQQLGQHLFPYWLLLVSSAPFNWIMLDLAVENLLFMKLGRLVALGSIQTCQTKWIF